MLRNLVAALLALTCLQAAWAYDCVSRASSNWTTATTWTSCNGTYPRSTDTATILDGHTVTVNAASAVSALTINSGGRLNGGTNSSRTLTVNGIFANGGTFAGNTGALNVNGDFVNSGTASTGSNANPWTITGSLTNSGSLTIDNNVRVYVSGDFINSGTYTFNSNASYLYVGGDLTSTSAFNPGNGWVVFNGTNQTLNAPSARFIQLDLGTTVLTLTGNVVVNNTLTGTVNLASTCPTDYTLTTPSNVVYHSCSVYLQYRLDEALWNGTAGEVKDISGNNLNATAVNGAATANASPAIAGTPGTCRYGVFDGNDYLQVPSGFPSLTTNFTITAWIRTTLRDATIHQRIFVDDQNNTGGYGFSLGDPGAGRLRFFSRGPGGSDANISLDTADVVAVNNWYFVAAVADISNRTKRIYVYNQAGTLLASPSYTYSGTWGTDGGLASIGGELNGTSETSYRFYGNIDELTVHRGALTQTQINTVRQSTHPCSVEGPDHIRIEHDGNGLTCTPETITIKACANSDCSIPYTATSVSGNLTWSGIPGGTVPFNITSGGITTVSLPVRTPQTVTLGTSIVNPPATSTTPTVCVNSSNGTACDIVFANSGFLLSVPDHVAETSQTLTIAAIRKDDNTQRCVPAFRNVTRSINLKCGYMNPNSGYVPVRVGGTALNSTNNASNACDATGQNIALTFQDNANAQATATLLYADVGQMNLTATYIGSAGTDDAGLTMTGSGSFVAKPKDFLLSGIQQTAAPQLVNPGAVDANSAKFVKAGEAFSVTVTARNAINGTTRNFGRESSPESVKLTPTLVAPSGGLNPALAGSFGAFANGVAAGTGFSWGEVGVITLTPEIAPQGSETVGDYLGAGNVVGAASGNVGRFYPDHFTLSNLTLNNRNGAACNPASTFTYMGEPLGAAFKLTAKNAENAVTRNYRGGFAKLDLAVPGNFNVGALDSFSSSAAFAITGITQANPGVVTTSAAHGYTTGDTVFIGEVRGMNSVNGKAYAVTVLGTATFALQGVDTSGYSAYTGGGVARRKATTGDDLSARVSALASNGTWSAVAGSEGETSNLNLSFAFNRATNPDGPLALEFGLAPADPDGVLIAPYDMDFPPASTLDRTSIGYAQLLFGRLRLSNAHGSERLNLPIPIRTDYWNGAAFVTNVMDSCTAIGANSVLLDNRKPGITLANMPASNFTIGGAFKNGVGDLRVLKPVTKPASRGSVDVCLDLDSPTALAPDAACAATARANLPWLQGNWSGTNYNFDPRARATFGVFKNPGEFIYIREMY